MKHFRKVIPFLTAGVLIASVLSFVPKKTFCQTVYSSGPGLASDYPGDKDIHKHPAVVFAEDFEWESMDELLENWSGNMGAKDHRLNLDEISGPDGHKGKSLKMTILRGKGGEGSELKKIFDEGYEHLFFRFYVKFDNDY